MLNTLSALLATLGWLAAHDASDDRLGLFVFVQVQGATATQASHDVNEVNIVAGQEHNNAHTIFGNFGAAWHRCRCSQHAARCEHSTPENQLATSAQDARSTRSRRTRWGPSRSTSNSNSTAVDGDEDSSSGEMDGNSSSTDSGSGSRDATAGISDDSSRSSGDRHGVTTRARRRRWDQWAAPSAAELFALSRWGLRVADAEVEDRLLCRLKASHLPHVWIDERVAMSEAIVPLRRDSIRRFVEAYVRVVDVMGARMEPGAGSSAPSPVSPNGGGGVAPPGTWRRAPVLASPSGAVCSCKAASLNCAACTCRAAGSCMRGAECSSGAVCSCTAQGALGARGTVSFGAEGTSGGGKSARGAVAGGDPAATVVAQQLSLRQHLQRKLVGFVRARIHEAQDFLAATCYGNEDGVISEEKKRRVSRVNNALAPWVRVLARICTGPAPLKWADAIWRDQSESTLVNMTGTTVYARVNLDTGDAYVGETKEWDQRVKQHFMATVRHSSGDHGIRKCRSCKEHTKYRKHRVCAPHKWLIIALYTGLEKYEAKRIERQLVQRWKPSLNAGDKPFWLMKETYVRDVRTSRRQRDRPRAPPWRKRGGGRTESRPGFTTFEVEEEQHYDLGRVLKTYAEKGEGVRVKITCGRTDVTRWDRIVARFGESYLVEQPTSGEERISTVLRSG